ncbi:hypothetical protein ACOTF6_09340 [Achromobacter xylosoxidans]
MTQQDDITQRVPMAEEILGAIRSAGYRDHPTNIERKRVDAILSAVEPLLSKLRAPVSDIREGFELTYAVDADDPACASDLSHFTNGWQACIMSQVRAPVADERLSDATLAALVNKHGLHALPIMQVFEFAKDVCAALASAPVAVPVSPDLQAQIVALRRPDWPSTGDRSSFHEGYETARVDILRLLRRSAPVAREALGYVAAAALETNFNDPDARIDMFKTDLGLLGYYHAAKPVAVYAAPQASAEALEVARAALMEIADLADVEADQRGVIVNQALTKIAKMTVAPQASAEDVHNAALEEAAQAAYNALFPTNDRSDWTELAESAAYHAKYACQCIRALKTQADKDGGQQRAGDELTRLLAENQRLRNGVDQDMAEVDRLQALYDSEWRKCKKLSADASAVRRALIAASNYIDTLGGDSKSYRAALSAPQAEQGERDA